MRTQSTQAAIDEGELVLTLTVGGQPCGVPVLQVRDVLGAQGITPIPLAPPEIEGAMNLRGRIVTAVDLRRRLGLPSRDATAKPMSIVVEQGGELYSMLADAVGEVVPLLAADRQPNPPTLDPAWREVSRGVHRRDGQLLILLDVERLLAIGGGR
ncbi:chemotaxis protein CheW [Falsiroseomonas bella]|uniref:Chemotaxis protein CheW n=1 Tax=Falsiroseomonas bella TaxID=2184016 RepID=A0A317FC28_9PROT|nr:chemotaxis protein CheW [Falsiroseomonas bella]PWS35567.1 chemotaxis protein CheW [Falsiroseomonas bella]